MGKPRGSLEKKVEPTGKLGIGVTAPQHLLHVKCDCGNEMFMDGKEPGWQIDLKTGVEMTCPCGKVISVPTIHEDSGK